MTERIPCRREGCSNTILPATAAKTGGICMPCKQEIAREEHRKYIEVNRRDVNLYEGMTDPVEILKVMHTHHVRDELIRYIPYGQSKEQVFLSLSAEQQVMMVEFAMDLIRTEDADTGKDILVALVCYHGTSLSEQIPELLAHEIYYPVILYKSASPEVRDQLLQQVKTDDENRNFLLLMLAYIGDDVVVQQFQQWKQSPPPWADQLYVAPEQYATEAGWELTTEGKRRMLFTTPSYSLYVVDEEESSATASGGEPISMLVNSSDCCPWCSRELTVLVSLDAHHPALREVSWKADELQVQTCMSCSCYGVVYMEMSAEGEPVWSTHNVMPMGVDEIDAEDHDPFTLDTAPHYHIATKPRNPYHGSEWANEPSLSQIGGHPGWVQDAEYATCPSCSTRMKAVGQVNGEELAEYGEGMYYMLLCEPCQMTAVTYQQS
ncbi:DUF1963 domain-containing protein [Paenibacillus sp. ACRSA]|uniref:DUF1963 domain-containing protein n=1 Tax=Paenibacillus sp. ACRSA TaxID=2918211 RepID=UPI001EF51FFD|nr:DUF1963 domain-containing protein [Paenibacillus sp. ACRSA]MCG7377850.1 DUF1963 domain-containing protein [Paenibacillus sp. ACRSA]